MAETRIPGASVAVIENGEVVATELLGVSNAETGEKVTAETVFEAASLSKPVFATIVLRMAERGELDLDRPLAEMLSYDRISHDPLSEALTARIVLSHRTGLPNWGQERLEFDFEPGERFGYSGEGYVYLQKVVEATTGLTLDVLAQREVFQPLGMTHSRYSWPEGEPLSLAMPHDRAGRLQSKREPRTGNAAASLHTTAADYGRFVAAWIDGGLLEPETVAAALEPLARVEANDDEPDRRRAAAGRIAWGLGWGLQLPEDAQAHTTAFHWGDNGDFKAFVAFDRTARSGIVYFTNGFNGLTIGDALVSPVVGSLRPTFDWLDYGRHDDPGSAERIAGFAAEAEGQLETAIELFESALAAAPGDEALERRIEWLKELRDARKAPVEIPAGTLERYAGLYGPRSLAPVDGALVYRRGDGPAHRLIALSPTLFALEEMVDFRLEVVLGEDGAPSKLVGHYVNGGSDENPRTPDPPPS